MTGEQVETLLTKAESDPAFVGRLLTAPRTAAAELGITLDDQEVDTLSKMGADDLRTFIAEYRSATDPEKRRAAC